MRRRSILAGGVAGAAALVAGAAKAEAAPAATAAAAATPASADVPWASRTLRDLAQPIGLRIGSALTPQDIETASYAAIAGSEFSVVTPANAMKWDAVEPTQGSYDWAQADELVNFAAAHNQLVRGHCFVWHNQLPNWLVNGFNAGTISKTQLWGLLEKHIFTELERYKGKIWQWDVANEFFTDANPSGIDPNNWWIQALGDSVIPQAFGWAHEADPHALLFYNDYNITGEDGTNAKFTAVYDWVKQQRDAGVPIHGVGTQAHLDTQYGFDPQRFQSDLESYGAAGLRIAITEADVRTFVNNATDQVPTDSLSQFAQPFEYSAMLQAAISVPEVISFTVWGWTDYDSWVPGTFSGEGYACIYDVNQQPKQAYYSLLKDLQLAAGTAPRRAAPPRA